ncbi:MAG: hypothetical protein M0002_17940 [Rhodospirillales bacterium]|nr:hypothetical protein [Rhodospirillales bacterium]
MRTICCRAPKAPWPGSVGTVGTAVRLGAVATGIAAPLISVPCIVMAGAAAPGAGGYTAAEKPGTGSASSIASPAAANMSPRTMPSLCQVNRGDR